jgi:hypothetical protein
MRTTLLAILTVVALWHACMPGDAHAVISTATTIDGPGEDIVELGGVAMSEDGTGGLVYSKLGSDGRVHIYAVRFVNGKWQSPARVDVGQNFDSSWPAIGAGDGGRLVVTWVHEFGFGTDRLFSASLDPGASRFQKPIPIDFNVGEALAIHPSIAMNRGGAAYIAYRVLGVPRDRLPTSGGQDPDAPPGYFGGEVRVARYNGWLWSQLGQPADRNQNAPFATPSAANSPKVGIDVNGNGIIAFHEPDDEFIDRVWARRIFGSTFGIPLIVSPQQFGGAPLRGPADAFSLDVTGFGQGAVALRQQPGPQSGALSGAHVFVNLIPETFSDAAARFAGARLADGTTGGSLGGAPSVPSAGVSPDGSYEVAFGLGPAGRTARGGETSTRPPEALGDSRGAVSADPVIEVAETAASVTAWKARQTVVGIEESREDGRVAVKGVRTAAGGAVHDVQIAGSNLGDALVAFLQGDQGGLQIGAAAVDAPAQSFAVEVPLKFVRSKKVRIDWDAPRNALSELKFTVRIGRRTVARRLERSFYRVPTRKLKDGRLPIIVTATDGNGQHAKSTKATLRLDRKPPRVRAAASGKLRVRVRIVDGARRRVAGPTRSQILWGDGKRSRGIRVTHRYRKPGTYRVTVIARDRAGNTRKRKLRVRVR